MLAEGMDPVTHFMTGACLARTGLNRKAAYTTLAMTLAAEMPDLDTMWSAAGPVAGFQHHRGWTHTFVGIPFEALVLVGLIRLLHRWRTARGQTTLAPVRWGLLWCFSLLALLSHLFLDWTNNYGIRPFFPFNPRWYEGSFVFIIEPVILLILLAALGAPSLFGLIHSEIGVRRRPFRGRGWAMAGVLALAALWSWRAFEHQQAIDIAAASDYAASVAGGVRRIFASPEPVNPWRWHVVYDVSGAYQLAAVDTRTGQVTVSNDDLLYKPPTTLATLKAKRSPLGEAYLDWSSWPLVTDIGLDGDGLTEVTFRDARFLYSTSFFDWRKHPPLGGVVYIDADRQVHAMEMDGRQQK
ncbi:MAG TPA: metal-dependent hydrolase [Granulicella sp.]